MNSTADFIIRIKNAGMARRREILIPYSTLNKNLAKVMVKEGFLDDVKEVKEKNRRSLTISLKYDRRTPVFTNVKVVSKPSLRIYSDSKSIEKIERRGNHTVLVSTSLGVMTGAEARKKGVGGEILFEIW